MEPKGVSLRDSLDETELERLSFIVYKKAMSLIAFTGTVLALGLGLFGFFGFDKWRDINASVKQLEERTRMTAENASNAQRQLDQLKDASQLLSGDLDKSKRELQGDLNDALVQTGRMIQVGEEATGIQTRINEQEKAAFKRIEDIQKENGKNLRASMNKIDDEVAASAKSRADGVLEENAFQQQVSQLSSDLSAKVERSLDAGFTVLVLQDKRSTSIPTKDGDISITLGDAKTDQVDTVLIKSGAAQLGDGISVKPNDEIKFKLSQAPLPPGKKREYTFRILNINMLALRDLVTCELRWELVPDNQVARSGGQVSPAP